MTGVVAGWTMMSGGVTAGGSATTIGGGIAGGDFAAGCPGCAVVKHAQPAARMQERAIALRVAEHCAVRSIIGFPRLETQDRA
jgi:hypothetical protein